jgi:hypothetical protein
MVPFTTQSMRSLAVMGRRASLLLELARLKDVEEASLSDSGTEADATVPGRRACWAKTVKVRKRKEQLALQIISCPPTVK